MSVQLFCERCFQLSRILQLICSEPTAADCNRRANCPVPRLRPVRQNDLLTFQAATPLHPLPYILPLPPAVAAHVTLHDDNPEFKDYEKLKRYTNRYIKINMGLDAQRARPLKLVEDAIRHVESRYDIEPEEEDERSRDAFEDADDELDIPGFEDKSIPDQLEIFAFMKAKG